VNANSPSNLRVASRYRDAAVLRFDGDVLCNDYRLFARSKPLHGHQPLIDDPFGEHVFTESRNGTKWHRVDGKWKLGNWSRETRRTWTQIGGYDAGTGESRTRAKQDIWISVRDMPDKGPWQLLVNLRSDASDRSHSNMVEWDPASAG